MLFWIKTKNDDLEIKYQPLLVTSLRPFVTKQNNTLHETPNYKTTFNLSPALTRS